jgi:prolyl oligopeptidase
MTARDPYLRTVRGSRPRLQWDGRRHFIAAVAVAALFAACSETPQKTAPLTNVTTRAATAPFEETVFGNRISDPYRWMEDPARLKDMVAWVTAASDSAKGQLAKLPGRAGLARVLGTASRAGTNYSDLQMAGGRIFAQRLDADASIAKLVVREGDGKERVLLDPAKEGGGEPVAINNYTVSPSGALLAIHTAKAGGEVGLIRFMDVTTGAWKNDELAPVWGEFDASWIDEGEVIYTRMDEKPDADPLMNMQVFVHVLGKTKEQDKVVIAAGAGSKPKVDPVEMPWANHNKASDWSTAFVSGARADSRVFLATDAAVKAGSPQWREVATYDDRVAAATARGNDFYFITTKGADNGELRRMDAKTGTLAKAEVVIPVGERVLTNAISAADGVYVETLENGLNGLLFLVDGKGPEKKVDLEPASVDDLQLSADGKSMTFSVTTWTRNSRHMVVEGGIARETGIGSATYAGAEKIAAIREEATSADGTKVPLTILVAKSAKRTSNLPTLLEGYGSYGIADTPSYYSRFIAWTERGGVYADCAVRGGGDKGRAWHEAGRSANKPNAHADLIACAEKLVDLKLTDPAHLAVMGTSAGGLLAPVAALKRPDLFKVVVPRVAISNATRLAAARNGPNQYAEMGDPTTEAGFKALLAQDGYVMLDAAKDSPDWFITVGLNDHRVEPWMSAKLAARAIEKMGATHVVLVRADAEAGHGIGSTRDQTIEEWADTFSFLLNRFGDPDFQLPAK